MLHFVNDGCVVLRPRPWGPYLAWVLDSCGATLILNDAPHMQPTQRQCKSLKRPDDASPLLFRSRVH